MRDMRPAPMELQGVLNPESSGSRQGVADHRNLFCNRYDDCLDQAVKSGWDSFTCVQCPLNATGAPKEKVGIDDYATQRRMA